MLNENSIFTFANLPEFAKYNAIYFVVKGITEDAYEEGEDFIDVITIIEKDGRFIKGEKERMNLTDTDKSKFGFKEVTDDVLKTKLLLME